MIINEVSFIKNSLQGNFFLKQLTALPKFVCKRDITKVHSQNEYRKFKSARNTVPAEPLL